jgi:DNA-binding MurR/RpiR family transcriptional regulator
MDPIAKLLKYYNTHKSTSTYYRLVIFVLKNIEDISNFSINDFSEKTFVSKSTVTRFVHFLGLKDFHDFKKYFDFLSHAPKNYIFRESVTDVSKLASDPQYFFENYAQQIINSIKDTVKTLDLTQIDQLINQIFETKRVAILGYGDTKNIAKDIQLGCLVANQLVEVAESEEKFSDIVQVFTPNDLIIVLSNYGNFFNHFHSFYYSLVENNIPLILITQNYNSMESFRFKQTIYLSSQRILSAGNFPLRLFSDYLVRRMVSLANRHHK